MKVFVFFLLLASAFGLWQVATRPKSKAFRNAVRPFVLPAQAASKPAITYKPAATATP